MTRAHPRRHGFRRAFPAVETHALRVLSYNIQGHGALFSRCYLERIARVISEVRPDVVGLQEVHRRTWQSRFEDQAEALGRLTGLNASFGPSFPLRGGEFGNAVLTAGEVLGAEVVPLPGAGEPRTLLHSKVVLRNLEDKAQDRALDFYVTHLAA